MPSCRSLSSICGCSRWNAASSRAGLTPATHCSTPTVSVPRSSPRTASTASRAARAPASVRSASTSSARPASVSRTVRVVRLNNGVRSSCSSARTEAESPDCDTARRSAARVKCCSSATATKCSS